MNQGEVPENIPLTIIEVLSSSDGMTGFIKLTKQGENPEPATKEKMIEALTANGVIYGLKESSIEKLAARPIYNIKIEVAKGLCPVDGQDGQVTYYVKRDMEYQPEYSLEGSVDYKNLDYFQIVKKNQILAEIMKKTEGKEGINIFGAAVPARNGRPESSPAGKNTRLIQDGTVLVSDCDGVIRFIRDTIDVNEILKINSDVDQLTGNINFSGDVSVEGDVCDGFTVRSGGNVIVKGVVSDAAIDADGNVHISKGINGGGGNNEIIVRGDLRCKYIENANIHVEGNICADYIINSNVLCMGNIELSGSRELIAGGEIKVLGELFAKDIGAENERITKIEILGIKILDTEKISSLTKDRDDLAEEQQLLTDYFTKFSKSRLSAGDDFIEKMAVLKKQIIIVKDKIELLNNQIQQLQREWTMEYPGSVSCRRKMYQGVKINFGEERFSFNFDNIEHCKIFWCNGTIIQGTL
ncbi:MAG: FapA family protein [Eubacteriales bacterium]|nr:FapA family protein [Eubacteriales bacterium]MDD3199270.1 FapA family protein [Eubacteriales bacterium]MDD4629400.1 FapA family protein [Eubacteriales bacterium]